MEPFSLRSMKFTILKALSANSKQHKINLIGRPYQQGGLEYHLNRRFQTEDRVQADRAFEELKADGLIRPTYDDIVDPENWVEITEAGHQAIERHALDDLDSALQRISPHLVELRDGAWAAIASRRPDAIRQAAHSGRELIDQTLRIGAPDEEVKAQPGFTPDLSSNSGITRRHRIIYLMKRYCGRISDTDLNVVEKACDLVLAVDRRLMAFAHASQIPPLMDVQDSLRCAEIALRRILVDSTTV